MESRIDEDIVALDVDRGACFGFNATAAWVWTLIEQPARLSDIRQNLLAEFRVDPDTCDRELRALLRQLEQDGLLAMEAIDA
jgi:hypothetical protein